MQYDFDQFPGRRGTDSVKWHIYDEDVLPMWVADMDFVSPQPVTRALQERAAHGFYGYPRGLIDRPEEVPAFRQAVIDWLAERYAWRVQPEDIFLLPGVVVGFNLACHALAVPDGGVLIQTPVYFPILEAAETTGALHQEMELTREADGSYSVDWGAFTDNLTPQTRLFILCNPHNPLAKVFQRAELERMAEICLQHNVTICSDEIHADLTFEGHPHIPIASLHPEIARNTITLIAPSKTFNIAGLQCSIAIISNPELRQRYLQARKGLVPWVNLMGLVAGQAAYQEGAEWLAQVKRYLQANRDFLYEYVQTQLPGVEMALPQGTYMAWLDCRQAGIDGSPYEFFRDKARVAFNDGAQFGKGGEGFVRLNFATPRSMLVEALERMKKALPQP